MCEYPNKPAALYPYSFSAISEFGLEFAQPDTKPRRHGSHDPHAIVNGTITRSPGRRFATAGPTSTTRPINSWPRMSPSFIDGMNPLYRWQSEPQMAVVVTSTIASRGF